MAKISNYERQIYGEKIAPYRTVIDAILERENEELLFIQQSSGNEAFKRLALCQDMLNVTSYYIILNGVSLAVLKVKNEEALNEARKTLYKAVIYLEQVVTNLVDVGFSEYEDKLAEIAELDSARRYALICKIGLTIQLLESAYGDSSKWRWAFVELEGRYAAASKNILDMKNAVTNTDPRSPNYAPTVYHVRLVQRLLSQAADRYREKYELFSNRIEDYLKGTDFLNALKRMLVLMGDREEAEGVRKKIEVWTAKLELDMKKRQEAEQNKEKE
jgi:hypothetical protein